VARSDVDVCNLALGLLGHGKVIRSLSDTSEEAIQCRLHYERCRTRLLREYRWPFTKAFLRPAGLDVERPGWRYVYAVPDEVLFIRYIFNGLRAEQQHNDMRVPFEIQAGEDGTTRRVLCTDYDPPNTSPAWPLGYYYTRDAVDPAAWPSDFEDVFAWYLASIVAFPLTKKAELAVYAREHLRQALGIAGMLTLAEQQAAPPPDPPELLARG
jgi:hypothetical protein